MEFTTKSCANISTTSSDNGLGDRSYDHLGNGSSLSAAKNSVMNANGDRNTYNAPLCRLKASTDDTATAASGDHNTHNAPLRRLKAKGKHKTVSPYIPLLRLNKCFNKEDRGCY